MDTWVAAAASTDHGKPAGVLPSAIHWPDGRVGGVEEQWWNPKNFSSARLYRWPSAMSIMLDTLLLTYHITGDEKYLAPLRSMAAIRLKWLNQRPCEPAATGSEAWCAEQLGFLVGALAKCKQLTGTSEFDPLLAKEGFSCLSQQVAERGTMVAALRDNAEALRVNFAGYTSEVRYTDRVLRFPSLFTARMMFAEPIPAIKRPNPQLLYSLATGDPGDGRYFPLAAVRWLTPPREIAALVTETGRDRLAAELYHFGTGNRPMQAELYLLSPGDYAWTLEDGAGLSLAGPTPVAVSGRRTRVGFELPPRRLCVLRVAKPR
jgi:hypothetical protein